MKVTSFSNCFEPISLAWQFASVSSSAGVLVTLKLVVNVVGEL